MNLKTFVPFNAKNKAFFRSPFESLSFFNFKLKGNHLLDLTNKEYRNEQQYLDVLHRLFQAIFSGNAQEEYLNDFLSFVLANSSNQNIDDILLKLDRAKDFQEKCDFVKNNLAYNTVTVGYIPVYFTDNDFIFIELFLSRTAQHIILNAYPILGHFDGFETHFYQLTDSFIYSEEFDNQSLIKEISSFEELTLFIPKSGNELPLFTHNKEIYFHHPNNQGDFSKIKDLSKLLDCLKSDYLILMDY